MEKQLDSLFDLTYDYDIALDDEECNSEYLKQNHDFAVCYARFLCLKTKYATSFSDKFIQSNFGNFEIDEDMYHSYIQDDDYVSIQQRATNYAFNEIKDEVIKLARTGNLKAIALYLRSDKNAINDVIIDKHIIAIKNKKIRTAEEWEVLASAHYFDQLDVRYENVGQMFDKIWMVSKRNYIACEIQSQVIYEKTMLEMLYLGRKIHESEFAKAYQKAMLGYYIKSFYGENMLENISDYLRLIKGGYDLLVEKNVFANYSDGKFFVRKDFYEFALKGQDTNKNAFCDQKKYSLDEAFKIFAGMFNDYDIKKVDEIFKNMSYAFVLLKSEDYFVTKEKKNIAKGYNILGQIAKRKLYLQQNKVQKMPNNLETSFEMQ